MMQHIFQTKHHTQHQQQRIYEILQEMSWNHELNFEIKQHNLSLILYSNSYQKNINKLSVMQTKEIHKLYHSYNIC